jgi:Tol biopolymer transport system component
MLKSRLSSAKPPQEFAASSRYDSYPAFSPDGGQLAFYSNRSGSPEVWIASQDGASLRRITANSVLRSGPGWSPDGRSLVYASGRSLAISAVSGGGKPVHIDTPDGVPQHPVWAPDGKTIFYSLGSRFWRVDVDGGARRMLGTRRSILSLLVSPDGRFLYFTRPGRQFALCRIPVEGGDEQVIEDGLSLASIAITRRYLYLVRADGLYALPLDGGALEKIGATALSEASGIQRWETRFTVSPDDSSLVFTLTQAEEVDLELLRDQPVRTQ